MPDLSRLQKRATERAKKNLKKIIAGRGGIEGRFYFTGSTDAAFGVVAISLAAKDPDGKQVAAEGKTLRKELRGAKFARGIVRNKKNKLVFEVGGGTAGVALVKKSFRESVSDLDGLAILKRAVVTTPKSAEQDIAADTEAELDADSVWAEMSTKERAEMWALREQQAQLGDLNTRVKAFLTEDVLTEVREQITEELTEIERLAQANPVDLQALAARRSALAGLAADGPDPFPEVGQAVSPEIREVFQSSIYQAILQIRDKLQTFNAQMIDLQDKIDKKDHDQQVGLEQYFQVELLSRQRAAQRYLGQLKTLIP